MRVKLTLLPTLKRRTESFPLMVTDCPVPSRTVSVVMLMVLVSTITPLQPKVTFPPPASAVSRADWSQIVTVPFASAEWVKEISQQKTPNNSRSNKRGLLGLEKWGSEFETGLDRRRP